MIHRSVKNLSRHMGALVNATTDRIKFLVDLDPKLSPEQRDELRWLYRVQRPALDAAVADFNQLVLDLDFKNGK